MYVCMYVGIYMCKYLHTYIYTYLCTYTYIAQPDDTVVFHLRHVIRRVCKA